MNGQHKTVLLDAAVEALAINKNGHYVDATFGRGGHSENILRHLDTQQGKLLVIDRDPQAIQVANALAERDKRVIVEHQAFEQLGQAISKHFDGKVDGILFDLGVSSPQIDQADRGFSFNQDGPLDMRMDSSSGETAAQWLNTADWKEMSKVFWRYGEEKNATKIAKEIVIYRENVKTLERTSELVRIVEKINKKKNKHPATRTFQAIRIYLNRELEQIENVLPVAIDNLKIGGRLAVISFHSLEDRIVKRFMKKQSSAGRYDKRMPIAPANEARIKIIGKAIKANQQELNENPRARSAIMRTAEKT